MSHEISIVIYLLVFFTNKTILAIFLILALNPPKERNYVFGYKSSKAFKSQRNWDFAQRYSGKLGMRIYGTVTLIEIIMAFAFEHTLTLLIVLSAIILLSLFVIIGLTEYRLSRLPKEEAKN